MADGKRGEASGSRVPPGETRSAVAESVPVRQRTASVGSIGPEALKAFAHPLRMAMYLELGRRGSATASGLARVLGESSGQTSYHLRQLERHGFVEDDPERSGGRERWWRAVGFDMSSHELFQDPDTAPAARAVLHSVIAERTGALTVWAESVAGAEDNEGATLRSATLSLTREEAVELSQELGRVLDPLVERSRVRGPVDGVERYRVHLDVFPFGTPGSEPPAGSGSVG